MNPATGRGSIRGFTAIEITAVATIIAILALLLIPLLQERVEKTRLTAAKADIQQLMKIQMLVKADIGDYVRLQDLDNTQFFDAARPDEILELAVPHTFWNREMLPEERQRIAAPSNEDDEPLWKGPYLPFNHFRTLEDIVATQPQFVWGDAGNGGPIFVDTRDNLTLDKYPVDPWGNPYLFYGDGRMFFDQEWTDLGLGSPSRPPAGLTAETDFRSAALYSLGRDGLPGDNQPLTAPNLQRPYPGVGGVLGEGDDLRVEF